MTILVYSQVRAPPNRAEGALWRYGETVAPVIGKVGLSVRRLRLALVLLIPLSYALIPFPGASAAGGPQHFQYNAHGSDSYVAADTGQMDSMQVSGTAAGLGQASATLHESVVCARVACTALDANARNVACAATYGSETMKAPSGTIIFRTVGERCTTTLGRDVEKGMVVVSSGTGAYAGASGGGYYSAHFSTSHGRFATHNSMDAPLPEDVEYCVFVSIFTAGLAWIDPAYRAMCK